jgi:hypothetical protein
MSFGEAFLFCLPKEGLWIVSVFPLHEAVLAFRQPKALNA